jgi:hypothetical protein
MSNINVRVRQPSVLRVQVQAPTTINTSLRRIMIANAKLEELQNVDPLTYGLQDGFTVVYDVATQTWKTQHIQTVVNENIDVDGGSF